MRRLTAPEARGPVGRFAERVLPSMTPTDYVQGPFQAVTHPIESGRLLMKAITENPTGALPLVGPLKQAASDYQAGNYAGASGDLATLALQAIPLRGVVPRGMVKTGNALTTVSDYVPR